MGAMEDPVESLVADEDENDFAILKQKPSSPSVPLPVVPIGAVVAKLHGFDLSDRPLVTHIDAFPGQVVTARTCVVLRREMLGSDVLILWEGGNPALPIVIGVIQGPVTAEDGARPSPTVVTADDERYVISAEREIVLRCGDASITLTRAGKVIIKGRYILSRSSGYNKIKGAAIDIN